MIIKCKILIVVDSNNNYIFIIINKNNFIIEDLVWKIMACPFYVYYNILTSNNNTNNINISLMSEVNVLTLTSLKYVFKK